MEIKYLPGVGAFQSDIRAEASGERTVAIGKVNGTCKSARGSLLVRCGHSANAEADFVLLCQGKRRECEQKEDNKSRYLPVHENPPPRLSETLLPQWNARGEGSCGFFH